MTCMTTPRPLANRARLLGAVACLSMMDVAACAAEAVPLPRAPLLSAPAHRWSGWELYVEPNTDAADLASAWRSADPDGAAALAVIAEHAHAKWLGDWIVDPRGAVDAAMDDAGDQLRSFVVYNIPQRDCGNFSAGGAPNAAAYRAFVEGVADGLDGREAIVVLEPDALALTWCLDGAGLAERHELMSDAVDTLSAAGAAVYIDAGDSRWIPAATMAASLEAAGVDRAEGFALNVSHTEYTADERAYAEDLRRIVGWDAHYVVDTSRNGVGPTADHAWCNPLGRAIGAFPTVDAVDYGLDALLWIKPPGDSDGVCNGGGPAGEFWPEYAIDLVERAGVLVP